MGLYEMLAPFGRIFFVNMVPALIGTKKRQTQWFDEKRMRHPVTVLAIGPCPVVQIKTTDTDGYNALQIGFGSITVKHINKPQQGHYKKARLTKKQPRFLREVLFSSDVDAGTLPKTGDVVSVSDVFYPGDVVKITGVSKGKGFAGVMKRWNFSGGPATHGQSDRARAPGSIGSGTTPGRVLKGKHMAGRMGSDTVTIPNVLVVKVDEAANELWVRGLVPGAAGSLVTVYMVRQTDRPEPVAADAPVAEEPEKEVEKSEAKSEKPAPEKAAPEHIKE